MGLGFRFQVEGSKPSGLMGSGFSVNLEEDVDVRRALLDAVEDLEDLEGVLPHSQRVSIQSFLATKLTARMLHHY